MVRGASVVHHIPGRLRIRVPHDRRNQGQLADLREFIESLGGVRKVEINPLTGSILVHYRPESHEQVRTLLETTRWTEQGTDISPEGGELAEKIEKEAEFLSAHSELALQVVKAVKHLNNEIRDASGNMVDLKVLLPAGLALWAFFKVGADVATPLWITLGIFSFNSFVALHHPTTVHVSTQQMAVQQT